MHSEDLLSSIRTLVAQAPDSRSLIVTVNEQLGLALHGSRVLSFLSHNGTLEPREQVGTGPYEWIRHGREPARDEALLELLREFSSRLLSSRKTLLIDRASGTRAESALWDEVPAQLGAAAPLREGERQVGCVLVLRDNEIERFTPAELEFLHDVCDAAGTRLNTLLARESVSRVESIVTQSRAPQPRIPGQVSAQPIREPRIDQRSQASLERIANHSQAVFLTIDREHRVRWINKRAMDFFGASPEELFGVDWRELLHPEEREYASERVNEEERRKYPFEEEFRVLNCVTLRERMLLFQFTPVQEDGSFAGWDAFGIDLSARADAQAALELQTRKVQALYTVSAAIRGHLDPVSIGNRGLQAVLDACQANAGVCYLCPPEDPSRLALVAHRGFSDRFQERAERDAQFLIYARTVAEGRQSVLIESLARDRRVPATFAEGEGMRSAILVPILVDNETFGVIALFHRADSHFDAADALLLSAAGSQIGLSARQANLFMAYRRQTRNLLALYRISHELSSLKTLEEIFEQAFAILRDELGLKRVWLGLLGEGGTKLTGIAAFGPGWKRKLIELVVDVQEDDHPLAEVVKTKRPMVVENPQAFLGQFGLERFFARFAIHSLALAPLVTRGQVLGVLAAQPGAGVRVNEEELGLLSSIANELAALINTKRLEEKVTESEKTQSMALLAAGIAHNFNNVLQAVLGQASLLEMQKLSPEQVERAAHNITESATRGATLVRQLLSVANLEEARRKPANINELIRKEQEELLRLVPPHQTLKLSLKKDLPVALVDPGHLHRILQVLVKNAVEALKTRGFLIQIFSDAVQVDGKSLHFEVPQGEYVRIGVRDNGVGMDAETKRRCFDPFFSTKNVDPGTGLGLRGEGLGLSAAYALARKNGGRLTVDSRLGQGSLFTLYLPAQTSKPESEEKNKLTDVSSDKETGENAS